MPKNKKKFIDRKNAVTFHLVHRSQRDPLQADEDATKRVFVPIDTSRQVNENGKREERKAQLIEAGILFDDDYDYMQHLRSRDEINEVGPGVERFSVGVKNAIRGVHLPSEVLPSQDETDVGLLNMAHTVTGPQPDWDPDIVEALEGNFDMDDPENILEDDFVIKAEGLAEESAYSIAEDSELQADFRKQTWLKEHLFPASSAVHSSKHTGEGVADEDDDDEWEDMDDSDEDGDDEECEDTLTGSSTEGDGRSHGDPYAEEETRSRFTSYSMSSSIVPRTKGLQLLDERFEQMYAQYDDAEIGALDHEDISGRLPVSSAVLEATLKEFAKSRKAADLTDLIKQRGAAPSSLPEDCSHDRHGSSNSENEQQEGSSSSSDKDEPDENEKFVRLAIEMPSTEKWDCESILSTYSSLYNHPKVIEEPRKAKDLAKVLMSRPKPLKAAKASYADDGERKQRNSTAPLERPQGETAEERRARKQLVKVDRKKRREEKKATKDAFKVEQLRQEKEMINVRHNLQGVRIV